MAHAVHSVGGGKGTYLTLAEFSKALECLNIQVGSNEDIEVLPIYPIYLKSLFKMIDTKKDGVIDFYEWD